MNVGVDVSSRGIEEQLAWSTELAQAKVHGLRTAKVSRGFRPEHVGQGGVASVVEVPSPVNCSLFGSWQLDRAQ